MTVYELRYNWCSTTGCHGDLYATRELALSAVEDMKTRIESNWTPANRATMSWDLGLGDRWCFGGLNRYRGPDIWLEEREVRS